jgi:hypothetical protein
MAKTVAMITEPGFYRSPETDEFPEINRASVHPPADRIESAMIRLVNYREIVSL